jgi:hypothetical protein
MDGFATVNFVRDAHGGGPSADMNSDKVLFHSGSRICVRFLRSAASRKQKHFRHHRLRPHISKVIHSHIAYLFAEL